MVRYFLEISNNSGHQKAEICLIHGRIKAQKDNALIKNTRSNPFLPKEKALYPPRSFMLCFQHVKGGFLKSDRSPHPRLYGKKMVHNSLQTREYSPWQTPQKTPPESGGKAVSLKFQFSQYSIYSCG